MHVLHFLPVYIPAWQFGGPILSVSRLCEGLLHQGIDVRVITTNYGIPSSSGVPLFVPQSVRGVQTFYYPVDSKTGAIRSKYLIEALSEHMEWADILHISSIWQPLGVPVQMSAHSHNVQVIQTLRGALSPYSLAQSTFKKIPYFLLQERNLLQQASLIHCTSQQEQNEIQWLKLRPRTAILPNPVDLLAFSCSQTLREQWRSKHQINETDPLLLVAGRLHHKKGLDLLPPVLKLLEDKPWRLIIIGDDDGVGLKLRRSFDTLHLTHRCTWFPTMPSADLLHPFNAADWLLLPSRHENFGNIVVEALACGCGVITSNNVGVIQMLSDCPGVFSAPRHYASWYEILNQALVEGRPGKSAELKVKARFAPSIIANQAIEMYQSALANA